MGKRKQRRNRPKQKKELIHIGVPCVGDYLHVGMQQFLAVADRMTIDPAQPWAFEWGVEIGRRPVEFARNCLVKNFLASKASRLWMVDADMIPQPGIFNLLRVDADIAVPKMHAFKRRPETGEPYISTVGYKFNVNGDNRFNSLIPHESAAYDVDGCGTGCIVIRRKVIEDRRLWADPDFDWYGQRTLGADDAPPVFRATYKPNGEILRGEDLDYTWRAKQLGYTVAMHTGVNCGHAKTINLDDIGRIAATAVQAAYERVENAKQIPVDG